MSDKTKPPPEPAPSLADRHLIRAPGPGKYELAKYSDFAPGNKGANRWSFGGKYRLRREEPTPGPDKYSHQRTSFAGTKWTMAARFHRIDRDDLAPDPNAKPAPPAAVRTFVGGGPKYSMGGRTRPIRTDATPDPTKYDPLAALKRITTKQPSFSMGAKFRTIDRDPYYVPSDKEKTIPPAAVRSSFGGSKFSFGGKTRAPRDWDSPAPGHYPGANTSTIGGGPKFSMSARVRGGIAYGHFGDEPRLNDTKTLPSLTPQVVESR